MTGLRPDRMAELRALSVTDAAGALGLTVTRSNGVGPCPKCNAETRHPKRGDKRGALGVRSDGKGWSCFECGTTGDVVTLVALALLGNVPAAGDSEGWRDLLSAAGDRGLCTISEGRPGPTRPAPPRVVPKPPPPARLPPLSDELAALWASCKPVGYVPDVAAEWATRGGIDLGHVEDRDLARALPLGARCPRWAQFRGAAWSQGPHRLLIPMFNAEGKMTSLHARAAKGAEPKGLSPTGCALAGLVMADPLAQLMLAGNDCGGPVRVVIAEGGPDFLSLATHWSDADESAPAVLGVIAGSWSKEIAARIPDGAQVLVATHADEAGEKYGAAVAATLLQRCDVRRFEFRGEGTTP